MMPELKTFKNHRMVPDHCGIHVPLPSNTRTSPPALFPSRPVCRNTSTTTLSCHTVHPHASGSICGPTARSSDATLVFHVYSHVHTCVPTNQTCCVHAGFPPPQPETMGKSIDSAGAGASWQSPGWLTQLNLLWGGKGVGVAAWHTAAVRG